MFWVNGVFKCNSLEVRFKLTVDTVIYSSISGAHLRLLESRGPNFAMVANVQAINSAHIEKEPHIFLNLIFTPKVKHFQMFLYIHARKF